MPELQHPDIVGNFLSSYGTAQAQQQAQKDREFNKQRIMKQDQYAEEDRAHQDAARKTDIVARAALALDTPEKWAAQAPAIMASIGASGPVPGFDQRGRIIAEAQSVSEQLKAKMDERKFALDERQTNAQIAASRASAAKDMAAARQYSSQGGAVPEGDGLSPYEGITDPRQRDMMYRQLTADFNSRQKDYQQTRVEAQNILASTDEFLALNKKVGSGGVTGSGGLSSVPIVNSARNMVDSDWARMNAITDKLTPLMRQGLPGAASDRDMQTFRGATVGTGKLGEANVGIARGLQVAAKNAIDKGLFDEAYFRRNRHLQGSDNAWNRYLEENPIFDPQSDPTNPELNRSRKSWREYVSPSAQAAPTTTQQTGGLAPGTVEDGYVFRGGDPSNPANWSEAQ